MTDRMDRNYYTVAAFYRPALVQVAEEKEHVCACGAKFRSASRNAKYCKACKPAATKRVNDKAQRKVREKRREAKDRRGVSA